MIEKAYDEINMSLIKLHLNGIIGFKAHYGYRKKIICL